MTQSSYEYGWENIYKTTDGTALWEQTPVPFFDNVLDKLQQYKCQSVLDVGCGEGRNLRALKDAGFTAAGVDLAPTGLARAVKMVDGESFLLQGDCADLPFVSQSIDSVTCIDVIGHVDTPTKVLREISRMLKKDGLLIVNFFTMLDAGYGEGQPVNDDPEAHAFLYQNTIYRFFSESGARRMLEGWRILDFQRKSWQDPPHGDFRPYTHNHDCWFVVAQPASLS